VSDPEYERENKALARFKLTIRGMAEALVRAGEARDICHWFGA